MAVEAAEPNRPGMELRRWFVEADHETIGHEKNIGYRFQTNTGAKREQILCIGSAQEKGKAGCCLIATTKMERNINGHG